MLRIVPRVAVELRLPELNAAFWHRRALAVLVPVPEAPVDEDDGLVFRQNDVGRTRQTAHVLSETEPHPMEHRTEPDFNRGVPTPYPAHDPAALHFGQGVH